MAKKTRKVNQFFEALPGTTRLPSLPAAGEWRDTVGRLAERARPFGRRAASDLAAAGHDLADLAGRIGRVVGGRTARRLYVALLIIGTTVGTAVAVGIAGLTYSTYAGDLSNPSIFLNKKNTGTTILDRNGQTLYQVYGASNRQMDELDQLPKSMVDATLAAEDPHFYDHAGYSYRATARAFFSDLTHRGKVEGGSTITQQLVKNALLSPEKSFTRKFQELLLSRQVEHLYDKNQIIQMYLNEIYYGQGSYGVESAAGTYFHKPAKDLTLSESAMLAGLPLGPSRFDPNLDLVAARDRRNFVLDQMQQLGSATPAEVAAAKAQPIPANAKQVVIRAPHFVFYVLDELRRQYGDDLVEKGGITVYTSLDLNQQAMAEETVRTQLARLRYHHATNSGLVAMNPTTGEISAMVGSVDWNQPDFGKVNVALSELQPGSSFKPIAYATAFKKGWNGATVVQDKPLSLPNGDGTIYRPVNYDGRFRGPVTLRRALSNSLNIPAIEVLQYAGIHDTIATGHDLGLTTLNDESRFGLSLVLGGGEVRPVDMATVYATLANGGVKVTPKPIIKVLDRNSKPITKAVAVDRRQVIDPRIAYMLTNILSDNQARSEEFGPASPLKLSHPAAAKTGTTNDFRDNWTIGYTPDLVTSVWVGNNDHSPMIAVDGISGAAPIWHDFMERALAGTPVRDFVRPGGLVQVAVCTRDGGLANPWDQATREFFLAEAQPTKRCSSAPPPKPEAPKEPDPNQINFDQTPIDNTSPVDSGNTAPTGRRGQPQGLQ